MNMFWYLKVALYRLYHLGVVRLFVALLYDIVKFPQRFRSEEPDMWRHWEPQKRARAAMTPQSRWRTIALAFDPDLNVQENLYEYAKSIPSWLANLSVYHPNSNVTQSVTCRGFVFHRGAMNRLAKTGESLHVLTYHPYVTNYVIHEDGDVPFREGLFANPHLNERVEQGVRTQLLAAGAGDEMALMYGLTNPLFHDMHARIVTILEKENGSSMKNVLLAWARKPDVPVLLRSNPLNETFVRFLLDNDLFDHVSIIIDNEHLDAETLHTLAWSATDPNVRQKACDHPNADETAKAASVTL